jgi:hypothetical protein
MSIDLAAVQPSVAVLTTPDASGSGACFVSDIDVSPRSERLRFIRAIGANAECPGST